MNDNVKRLAVANGPNIFQMLLVIIIGDFVRPQRIGLWVGMIMEKKLAQIGPMLGVSVDVWWIRASQLAA